MKNIYLLFLTIATFAFNSLAQIPTNGLVGNYTFSDNADNKVDGTNNGVLYGPTLTTDRFNNPNSAYQFDGIDDYILLPSPYDLPARTVSFWFLANVIDADRRMYGSDNPNLNWGMTGAGLVNTGGVDSVYGALAYERAGKRIDKTKWHHLVFVYNSNTETSIYLDCQKLASVTSSAEKSVNGLTKTVLGGSRNLNSGYFFSGKMDDLRIYDRALSVSEITELCNETAPCTNYITINKYDTTQVTIYDTTKITVKDTTYITVADTLTIYDTVTVSNSNEPIPSNGLVGNYTFSNDADNKVNGTNNGVLYGPTLTTDRFNNPNSAYQFDGIDDYILLPSPYDLPARTVSFWFFADIVTNDSRLYGSDNPNLQYGLTAASVRNVVGIDSVYGLIGYERAKQAFDKSKWHHLVMVADGNNQNSIYFDCVKLASYKASANKSVDGLTKTVLGGSRNLNKGNFFQGKMDDLRIYDRALSETEIQKLCNEPASCINYVTVKDTTYITVTDTLTVYDTVKVTVSADTTYITVHDTVYLTKYDTVKVYDTIKITDSGCDTLRFHLKLSNKGIVNLELYPNPSNTTLYLSLNSYTELKGHRIEINNAVGRKIYTNSFDSNLMAVDVSSWSGPGIYLLSVYDANNNLIMSKRILITK